MSMTEASDLSAERSALRRWWKTPQGRFVSFYLILGLAGMAAGIFWEGVVILPTFEVQPGLSAEASNEHTFTTWFAADSWFSIIGIVLGLAGGMLAWRWFGNRGWLVILHTLVGSILAAVICVKVGEWLGPAPFADRLAAAKSGDVIEIGFGLRSGAAYLLWMFAAITPVMLLAAFSPDSDDEQVEIAPTMSE